MEYDEERNEVSSNIEIEHSKDHFIAIGSIRFRSIENISART